MGNTSCTPQPLVEVSAPGGKVLVPPHTAFTVHPPHYGRSGGPGSVYTPLRSQRLRRAPPDLEFVEGESEMGFDRLDLGMDDSRDIGNRGIGFGYPGRMPLGLGVGRRRDNMYRWGDVDRTDTMGGMGFPGMRAHDPRIGRSYSPNGGAGPVDYRPGPMSGLQPPGRMGRTAPPGYTPTPMVPPYSMGRVPGGGPSPLGPNPYAYYNRPASPMSTASTQSERPGHRTLHHPPGFDERVPMGIFTKSKHKPKPDRTTVDRLNCTQPLKKKVGPSKKEWIPGDNYLDACRCTTNCTCRAGHRVLYCSKSSAYPDGSDSEHAARYAHGEIRYILKKDLGKDCGDHSKCKAQDDTSSSPLASSSDTEYEAKKIKGKRIKRKGKTMDNGFQEMKEELLEAFDERIYALKKENSSKAGSVTSPKMPFGGLHHTAQNPFSVEGLTKDQKLAMGLHGGRNPYALGMVYDDKELMDGIERARMGNTYPAAGTRGRLGRLNFPTRERRKSSTSDESHCDLKALYSRRYKVAGRGDVSNGKWPGRRGSNDDETDSPFRAYRRSKSPMVGRGGHERGKNQARADTDDEEEEF